ncbi:MAG: hypothetical protein R8F63_00660 [Acidimicrobiales bacterium]|nr:hypothetical protein [Acidimicrobiales bacterium]
MADEWVFHKKTGVARVVERLPGRKLVVGNSSGRTTLERGYRYLDDRSLRVLSVTDQRALQRLVRESPAEIAERLLLDHSPMPLDQAVKFLGELGCSPGDVQQWSAALPDALSPTGLVLEDGHIRLDDGAVSDEDFARLIEQVVTKDSAEDQVSLQALADEGRLSAPQAGVVALLLAAPVETATAEVILEFDQKVMQLVSSRMTSEAGLVAVLLRSNGVKAARVAAKRIAELGYDPDPAMTSYFGALLLSMGQQSPVSPEQWAEAERSISRLGLLAAPLSTDVSSLVIQIASLERTTEEPNKRRRKAHAAIDETLERLALPAAAAQGLLRGEAAGARGALIVRVGSTLPLSPGGFRLKMLAWAATSPAGELVEPLDTWAGVSIAELSSLVHDDDPEFRELLTVGAARRGLSRHLNRQLYKSNARMLGDLLGAPQILELADPERVARALEGVLMSTTALARIHDRLVSPAVNSVADDAARALSEREADAVIREEELAAEIERQAAELAQARARLEATEQMLRADVGGATAATSAQLRQAWLDAARIAVDVAEEVRRFGEKSPAELRAAEASLGTLRAAGIRVEGGAGSEQEFDPELFRRLDDGTRDLVVVVEPAYVTDRFGDVTVVRYGSVRDGRSG